MQINIKLLIVLFTVTQLLLSCNEYTPKPVGYNRIDNIEADDVEYDLSKLSFSYSNQAYVDTLETKEKGEIWFNIVYPKYNAIIYCTYLPISKASLPKTLEDSYKLAFSHSLRADEINQKNYSNSEAYVFGTIYSIEGDVATPIQFYLTDSTSNFFRGSLYYNEKVNIDSISPVTEFILDDIQEMINTFSWKMK